MQAKHLKQLLTHNDHLRDAISIIIALPTSEVVN